MFAMGDIEVRVHSYGPGRPLGLVYFDPITGKKVAKSAETYDHDEAVKKAGVLEDELRSGRYKPAAKITWGDFRERYETERLASQSPSSIKTAGTAFNLVERVINPDRLAKLTPATLSRFIADLRAEGMKDSTLGSYLRTIKAALRWAVRMGLLTEAPTFDMPRAGDAKARPVTTEEFDRLILKAAVVRPRDTAVWTRMLNGLWLSGLRLGEAMRLSWDQDAPFAVDLTGRFPAFRIEARAQKGRHDERLPMTPDFATWLLQTPEADRHGPVFALPSLRDGTPQSTVKVGCTISAIGESARVVVAKDPDSGKVKYASAHDLRRSFGTRWAKRVMPAVLQRLMRHRSINTTMKYYVGIEADDVAADLWAKHGPAGNTFGNNGPSTAQNAESAPAAGADGNPCDKSTSEPADTSPERAKKDHGKPIRRHTMISILNRNHQSVPSSRQVYEE
jgi:integrase